ncbi:MAG: cytochrome c oxidase subunit II, partial [Chloroflexi bacterium]|nr:cytochrome c oxidase subunit II [Chloroflexota bacterium]
MKQSPLWKRQRWVAVVFVALALLLAFPVVALAQSPSPLAPGTDNAAELANLFWITLGIAAVVFVFTIFLILFAVFRYRQRDEDDDEEPEQIHGNARLELIWTIIPAIIMLTLFGLTFSALQTRYNAPEDSLVIHVGGKQLYWDFTYVDTNLDISTRGSTIEQAGTEEVLTEVFVPVGRPIQFEITSDNVIHSFWVPELEGKIDAIPGHVNTLWFEIDEPGTYRGVCAEFCGLNHWNMQFMLVALPEDDYQARIDELVFLANQRTPVGTDIESILADLEVYEADVESGEALFVEYGCTSCHSLDGSALVGPSMQGMGARA